MCRSGLRRGHGWYRSDLGHQREWYRSGLVITMVGVEAAWGITMERGRVVCDMTMDGIGASWDITMVCAGAACDKTMVGARRGLGYDDGGSWSGL